MGGITNEIYWTSVASSSKYGGGSSSDKQLIDMINGTEVLMQYLSSSTWSSPFSAVYNTYGFIPINNNNYRINIKANLINEFQDNLEFDDDYAEYLYKNHIYIETIGGISFGAIITYSNINPKFITARILNNTKYISLCMTICGNYSINGENGIRIFLIQ